MTARRQPALPGWSGRWTVRDYLCDGVMPRGVEVMHLAQAREPGPGPASVARWCSDCRAWHREQSRDEGPPPPEIVLAVRNATACATVPGGAIAGRDNVWLGGGALYGDADLEAYAIGGVARMRPPVRSLSIDRGCWLVHPVDDSYGHRWLDLFPRALLLDTVVDPDVPFVMRADLAQWLRPVLRQACASRREIVELDSCVQVARFGTAYVASGLRIGCSLDPVRSRCFADYRSGLADSGGPRSEPWIHFSRGGIEQRGRRDLTNRAEAELALRAIGARMVRAEGLPVADQVRAAAGSQLVSGEGGSAMCNCLFLPPGSTALVLRNARNRMPIHRMIAAIAGTHARFVSGRTATATAARMGTAGHEPDISERTWLGAWQLDSEDLVSAISDLDAA